MHHGSDSSLKCRGDAMGVLKGISGEVVEAGGWGGGGRGFGEEM